jgi:chromosome segregation ATPase
MTTKPSPREVLQSQKRQIDQLKAQITDLQRALVGPDVTEIGVDPNRDFDFCCVTATDPISIAPETLLASDKIGELERLTGELQEELRKSLLTADSQATDHKKEIEGLQVVNGQLKGENDELHKEIDRLAAAQVELQSEVRSLKADISEKKAEIDKLTISKKKLVNEQSDIEGLRREKGELLAQLEEARKARTRSDEQLAGLYQRMSREDGERGQIESNLRKEVTELTAKLNSASEKEKMNGAKLSAVEASLARSEQQVRDCQTRISSLETKNAQVRKENIEVTEKLTNALTELRRLSGPNEEVQTVRGQLAALRKQHQTLVEKSAALENRAIEAEKKAGSLATELERVGQTLSASFDSSRAEQAAALYSELQSTARQLRKENNELKMQIGQLKAYRFEAAEANKKFAEAQQSVDFLEARMAYLKQVIMQLLTAPFSQRQKIAGVLVELMSFTAREKEMIMKSPASGEDLSARLLYAFGSYV